MSFYDPKNPEDFKNERKAFFDANRDQNIWVPAGQQAPRPYISGARLAKGCLGGGEDPGADGGDESEGR